MALTPFSGASVRRAAVYDDFGFADALACSFQKPF
jgi:hypothetical protein